MDRQFLDEIGRRRTFGIISHPDAGKTTLTEKLLLFGGAIQLAGAIKARKAARHATSDWMKVEQERGISVTTSVMKFTHRDCEINLLDTPGHQDFSEDTYRVLTAVDSALMVIDSAKGVETQTEKLMSVCRMRNTPVITFINKLDREGREPLDLLHDIEDKLQIECAPMSWPIGMGKRFQGVYNLYRKELRLFAPGGETRHREAVVINDLHDPRLDELLGSQADELRDDIELLEGAANPLELAEYLKGNQTPVFFGSAVNNFGIEELLDALVELAPAPGPRATLTREVAPDEEAFSGFVFKIQANMDPMHRDRIAFLRICSGKFTRGMKVRHHRIGKDVSPGQCHHLHGPGPGPCRGSLPRRHHRPAQPRDHQDRRYLQRQGAAEIHRHPQLRRRAFPPGRLKNPLKSKQLDKGLTQLAEEGAIQVFRPLLGNDYIVGAVGVLQFDVTMDRLRTEYGVDASLRSGRLCHRPLGQQPPTRRSSPNSNGRTRRISPMTPKASLAFLAPSEWRLGYVVEQWPEVVFAKTREHQ